VFNAELVPVQARVLQALGSRHVMVVHGKDGLDEITLSGETLIAELKDAEVSEFVVHPADFGIEPSSLEPIQVRNAQESKAMLLGVLQGRAGPARDIVVLNAGAAIYVAGVARSMAEGVDKARAAISSGAARAKLEELVEFTNR
jgi:anthranilate phosphoribosyltransferase